MCYKVQWIFNYLKYKLHLINNLFFSEMCRQVLIIKNVLVYVENIIIYNLKLNILNYFRKVYPFIVNLELIIIYGWN